MTEASGRHIPTVSFECSACKYDLWPLLWQDFCQPSFQKHCKIVRCSKEIAFILQIHLAALVVQSHTFAFNKCFPSIFLRIKKQGNLFTRAQQGASLNSSSPQCEV